MSCKKHPKYKAKRKPRVKCRVCLAMWLDMEFWKQHGGLHGATG